MSVVAPSFRTIAKLEEAGAGANSARPIPRSEDAALGTDLKRPGMRGFCAVIFNCPTMKSGCEPSKTGEATTSTLVAEEYAAVYRVARTSPLVCRRARCALVSGEELRQATQAGRPW